jgi:hypothetical protein
MSRVQVLEKMVSVARKLGMTGEHQQFFVLARRVEEQCHNPENLSQL